MTNKEIFEFIYTSLNFIGEWIKNSYVEEFEQNLMLMDAVAYRLYNVGIVAENIDFSKLEKDEIVVFNKLIEFKNIFSNPNFKTSFLSDLIFSDKLGKLFGQIFFMLVEKSEPSHKIGSVEKNKLSRDYKYPIITSNSIWTVKKK